MAFCGKYIEIMQHFLKISLLPENVCVCLYI